MESDPAFVRVLVPEQIGQLLRTAENPFRLVFADEDGTLLSASDITHMQVRFTTDFQSWQTNSGGISISNGAAVWTDTNSFGISNRFYQVIEP